VRAVYAGGGGHVSVHACLIEGVGYGSAILQEGCGGFWYQGSFFCLVSFLLVNLAGFG